MLIKAVICKRTGKVTSKVLNRTPTVQDLLRLREVLDGIPEENDDGCGDTDDAGKAFCTVKEFRARSARVAKLLREAALLLPDDAT